MTTIDKKIEAEVASLAETGTGILREAQTSNGIAGDDLVEVTSWVTSFGSAQDCGESRRYLRE